MSVETKCGTYAGYSAHRRSGEPACGDCRDAQKEYMRKWRRRGGESVRIEREKSAARSAAYRTVAFAHPAELEAAYMAELADRGLL